MTPPCQRWHLRRESYRPAGEPIDPSRYGVEVLGEGQARDYVVRHHYSGSYPAARCRVGLLRTTGASRELVGVAVFSVPAGPKVIGAWLPHLDDPIEGVELGRFVLADDVPANGETWFLRRAFEALAAELAGWGRRDGRVVRVEGTQGTALTRLDQVVVAAWRRSGVRAQVWLRRPVHCLRRALRTHPVTRGVQPDVIDLLLGHAGAGTGGKVYTDAALLWPAMVDAIATVPGVGAVTRLPIRSTT